MARVVFRIDGTQETIRNISAFDMRKQQEARVIVKNHATVIRQKARSTVPVSPSSRKKSSGKPGDLKRSIIAKYYFDGLGAMIYPKAPKGNHRHLVEYGTGMRRNAGGANRGRMSAQPFMTPAKMGQAAAYNRDMQAMWENDQTIV